MFSIILELIFSELVIFVVKLEVLKVENILKNICVVLYFVFGIKLLKLLKLDIIISEIKLIKIILIVEIIVFILIVLLFIWCLNVLIFGFLKILFIISKNKIVNVVVLILLLVEVGVVLMNIKVFKIYNVGLDNKCKFKVENFVLWVDIIINNNDYVL